MRYGNVRITGLLFSALLFASCTCHKEVSPPPTFQERPGGFHVAQPKSPPAAHVLAPVTTPVQQAPPAEVAAAPSPTVAQLPDDFPKEVPVFKGAAVAQVQDLANNAHNVIFNVAAALGDISDFYQRTLTSAGWKVTQEFHRSNHAFMTFEKGQMIANVTIADNPNDPGKQVIAIMYEERKPLEFDEF